VEWWSGGVVEWWSGGVVEWWSGGVVECGDLSPPSARSLLRSGLTREDEPLGAVRVKGNWLADWDAEGGLPTPPTSATLEACRSRLTRRGLIRSC